MDNIRFVYIYTKYEVLLRYVAHFHKRMLDCSLGRYTPYALSHAMSLCVETSLAETRSPQDMSRSLLASWQKNKNGAADGDFSTRKTSMQNLTRDLQAVVRQISKAPLPLAIQNAPSAGPHASSGTFLEEVMTLLMEDLAKVVFKGLADPAEACR